jgi:hypothetical protein
MYTTLSLKQVDEVFKNDGLILIILHEKHGTRNVVSESSDGFFKFFLELLKDRKDFGYFHEPDEPQSPSMSEDAANALPAGPVKKMALAEIENYKQSLRFYKNDRNEFLTVNKALEEGNGRLAYSILKSRSDMGAEYEEMTVEEPEYA